PRYKVFDHGTAGPAVNGVSWGTSPQGQPGALETIQRAYARWVSANVNCTSWSSTYDGPFNTPTGVAAVNGQDGVNRTIFLGGANWTHDAVTLALTTTTFYTGT